ncbi:8243_t:CDS:2 [Entrophospora sp. SA101]|nr:8243_t:CDS:2 [Entrophospora sp. SA101]
MSKKLLKSKPDPITIKIRKDVDNDKYYISLGSSAEETFDFPDPQSIVQVCRGLRPPSKFIIFRISLQGYLAQRKLERCRVSKIASQLWNSLDQEFKLRFELLSNMVKKLYKRKKLIIQMYNPSSSPLTINDGSKDQNKETNNVISIEKKEVTNEERLEIATQLFPGFSEFLS